MHELDWDIIQTRSEEILSCGLNKLLTQPLCDASAVTEKGFGSYLISLNTIPQYIGEGRDLIKRLKQQFNLTTSTFYKNFEKLRIKDQTIVLTTIDEFKIQFISTNLGRKEVEEFGIVNLPTILNNFQKNKKGKLKICDKNGLWDAVQEDFVKLLEQGEQKIVDSAYTPWFETRTENKAGLYLLKDHLGNLLYVGESSNIGDRIKTHSGRTYFSALRRHIGTELLGFQLIEVNGKKRYFNEIEDAKVNEVLKWCTLTLFPVAFGRYELEEYLIKKYRPLLNRKDNKD